MAVSLLELDNQLSAKIRSFKRALASGKWNDSEVDEQLATFTPLEEQIANRPCRSLAELAVKARLARWLNGDCLDGDTVAESVLASIVDDIIRLNRGGDIRVQSKETSARQA